MHRSIDLQCYSWSIMVVLVGSLKYSLLKLPCKKINVLWLTGLRPQGGSEGKKTSWSYLKALVTSFPTQQSLSKNIVPSPSYGRSKFAIRIDLHSVAKLQSRLTAKSAKSLILLPRRSDWPQIWSTCWYSGAPQSYFGDLLFIASFSIYGS